MVTQMIEYEGRFISVEEVLKLKNKNTTPVISKVEELEDVEDEIDVSTEEGLIGKNIIEEVEEVEEEEEFSTSSNLNNAREEYKTIFGRKAHPSSSLETLLSKIKESKVKEA